MVNILKHSRIKWTELNDTDDINWEHQALMVKPNE